MYKSFDELVADVVREPKKTTIAIAAAADAPVVDCALEASGLGIATPVFVGGKERIDELLRERGATPSDFLVVDCEPDDCAQTAVELVKSGDASVLMKGLIETRDLLRPVVRAENGLRTGAVMSHIGFFSGVPGVERILATSDGGMIMYPTLEDKKAIIDNMAGLLRSLGTPDPKIAVLTAIETINPKMVESVEAAALREMNRKGEITGCTVEGPISYDVAMSAEIARHKGYKSDNCGSFDALVFPNISAGNILAKCYMVTCGAKLAGIVAGAKAPIVLTSRGSTAEEKLYSIALAARCAR